MERMILLRNNEAKKVDGNPKIEPMGESRRGRQA